MIIKEFLLNTHIYFLKKFYPYYTKKRMAEIRKKDKINVMFILAELSIWKTESLYLSMKKHPRFNVFIGVTESIEVPGSKPALIEYLEKKGYAYADLDIANRDIYDYSPDILVYYKPYIGSYARKHIFMKHKKCPCIHINYSLSLQETNIGLNQLMCNLAWKTFAENELVKEARCKIADNKGENVVITGLPVEDELMQPKELFSDPWKPQECVKKRIIYAPHHSLRGTNPGSVDFSTFIEFGEYMLELAEKYKDVTQWAFKPHPTLYKKLLLLWGPEKTESYYNRWKELENGQVELGAYMGLFKYSDAMIHDCGSFVMEYLYTNKPVMFLMHRDPLEHIKNQNQFGVKGFYAHYHGYNEKEIEQFVVNLINGVDSMNDARLDFYNNYLIPPHGKTASQNIINAILGVEDYSGLK